MYKNIFVDVNIWVDMFDQTRPFSKESIKCIKYLLELETTKLSTSCDVITTMYYLLSKKGKDMAFDAIEYVNSISRVVEFGNDEVAQSCLLMKQNPNFTDLEDTIQFVMAKKVEADLIISNDATFYSDGIELLNAKELSTKLGL